MAKSNLPLPSKELLNQLFDYDESNPALPLIWSNPPHRKSQLKGSVAGGRSGNYCYIKINRKRYCLHRIVWMFHTGKDPGPLTVDHKDRDGFNNLIGNLRLATWPNQMRNRPCKGYKYRHDIKKYQAVIRVDGRQRSLGYYSTAEEAAAAYNLAASEYHGEFFCPALVT
jgi:hypothetical protein